MLNLQHHLNRSMIFPNLVSKSVQNMMLLYSSTGMLSSGLLLVKSCLQHSKYAFESLNKDSQRLAKRLLLDLDSRREDVTFRRSSNLTQSAATLDAHFDPNEMSSDGITLVSDAMVAKCSTGNNTHVLLNCGFSEGKWVRTLILILSFLSLPLSFRSSLSHTIAAISFRYGNFFSRKTERATSVRVSELP